MSQPTPPSPRRAARRLAALGALALEISACAGDAAPTGFGDTPPGEGPVVRCDLERVPFDVPFPNDLFTVPDPGSPTGVRVSLRLAAPTLLQAEIQRELDRRPGFGTTAPITIPFARTATNPTETAIDLVALRDRHDGSLTFADDAVYLIDLHHGTLVPLELGMGSASALVRDERVYGVHDPRRTEPTLEFETIDERVDPVSGRPDPTRIEYVPEADGDFDGRLDVPNLLYPDACQGTNPAEPGSAEDNARDRCLADNLATFYERDSETLVLRPLVPLAEATRYAVVLTDRLVDRDGAPARSPFDTIFHPMQRSSAARLQTILRDLTATSAFGDLAGTGLEHVAFTWSFTTAPTADELFRVMEGLQNRGPLAPLAAEFAPYLAPKEVVGPIPQRELDRGEDAPAGWEASPECAPLLERPLVLDGAVLRASVDASDPDVLGLANENEHAALSASLDRISHVVLAELPTPYLLAGGPDSTNPTSAFDTEILAGVRSAARDAMQVWVFVPRPVEGIAAQPFDTVVYAHGFGSSAFEALPIAGALATQGLATVAFNATGHGPDRRTATALDTLLRPTCHARGLTAALATRSRDLDGDGDSLDDIGKDARNGHAAHVRDVVRQTAVDLAVLLRALRATGTDTDPTGGDFDADGTIDVGGSHAQLTIFGRSLGGAAAVLLGPLWSDAAAIAVMGTPGTLVDPWIRTGDPSAYATFTAAWLGPAIVGIPRAELAPDATRCDADELSLRLTAMDVDEERELEFACVDLSGTEVPATGGTVVVTNIENRERRCARLARAGRFRLPIPANVGDRLHVVLYDQVDAVTTYDPDAGCVVDPQARRIATEYTWGRGPIPGGTVDGDGVVSCSASRGCTTFQDRSIPAGAPLQALTGGAGLIRQSPTLRRWLDLARHVTATGDPAAYAPLLGLLSQTAGSPSAPEPTAALFLVPVGSVEVPVDLQVAIARAAGIVPFLDPTSAESLPELADYATPHALYSEFNAATPHRELVTSRVLEAQPRLARTPPVGTCGANELTAEEAIACHPACEDSEDCPDSQVCDPLDGRCRSPAIDPAECDESLLDPDALDRGRTRQGEPEAVTPLRLTRVAAPASLHGVDAVWEPRLVGAPRASDFGAWVADQPTLALLFPYLAPRGRDRLGPGNACAAFDVDRYFLQLIARYLSTNGRDPYYLSHPATHQCLEQLTCGFLVPPE
ncbi:MAG: hypothetical protein JW751_23520 [Polyangiaceae bacterium]|nr:hypothetical protein [Polyangiaceae bacterium]